MTEDDDTRIAARHRGDAQASDEAPLPDDPTPPDDATAVARRASGDSTRLSRRRIAESETQADPQPPTQASPEARPSDRTSASRRRSGTPEAPRALRPPDELRAVGEPDAAAGMFGGAPQHYYPRIRHTQDATGAGVWPEPPDLTPDGPQVLDQAGREQRRAAERRAARRRGALLVGVSLAAVASGVAVALTLL